MGSGPLRRRASRVSPFEMLHDEEVDGVFAADVVEGADVRVIEAGDGLCFALEALCESDIADFDGDDAFEPGVAGFVDFAHASCSEQGDDLVWPQPRVGR